MEHIVRYIYNVSRRHVIVDLFAGIIGVSAGFRETGRFRPTLFVDIDENAKETFAFNFPRLKKRFLCKDISKLTANELVLNAESLPQGIVGCPPCQGLSDVGSRRHVDGRNHLMDHYFRLVRAIRPKFFVMENVPRVLSYTRFQRELRRTERWYNVWTGVLNAADYGVPQTRQRAIIIGYRKSLGIPPTPPPVSHCGSRKVFAYDQQKMVSPQNTSRRRTVRGRHTRLKRLATGLDLDTSSKLPELVTCRDALSDLPRPNTSGKKLRYRRWASTQYQRLMRGDTRTVQNHGSWQHGAELRKRMGKLKPGASPLSRVGRKRHPYFSQAYGRLHPRGLARTVTTNFHNPGAGRFWHYSAQRTLTIREAARLQSIPDSFAFPDKLTRTAQKRLIGNAFPPLLAKAIAQHIDLEIGHLL